MGEMMVRQLGRRGAPPPRSAPEPLALLLQRIPVPGRATLPELPGNVTPGISH